MEEKRLWESRLTFLRIHVSAERFSINAFPNFHLFTAEMFLHFGKDDGLSTKCDNFFLEQAGLKETKVNFRGKGALQAKQCSYAHIYACIYISISQRYLLTWEYSAYGLWSQTTTQRNYRRKREEGLEQRSKKRSVPAARLIVSVIVLCGSLALQQELWNRLSKKMKLASNQNFGISCPIRLPNDIVLFRVWLKTIAA